MDTQVTTPPTAPKNRLSKYINNDRRRVKDSPMFGALTITRRPGESITIDDATIKVVRIRGRQAMLRVVAPKTTKVTRDELPAKPLPNLNHELLQAVIRLRKESQCPTGDLEAIEREVDELIAELV